MTGSEIVRRPLKVLAVLAVVIGLFAGFAAFAAGLSMGGAIVQGDVRGDTLRLAFNILPFVAALLFVLATIREPVRPAAATAMYGGSVILIAVQLMLPALR